MRSKSIDIVIPVKGELDTLNFNTFHTLSQSVRQCNLNVSLHIVEQGDKAVTRSLIPPQYNYHFIHSKMWNKPLALNHVLYKCEHEWCMFLDGDYIVPSDFLTKLYPHLQKDNVFFQCKGYNLPESFKAESYEWDNDTALSLIKNHQCTARPESDFGGCQIVPVKEAKEIGGLNEHIKLYGAMHHEFRNRLANYGLIQKNLFNKLYLLHQYHPPRLINNEPVTSEQMALQRQYNRELARLAKEKKITAL